MLSLFNCVKAGDGYLFTVEILHPTFSYCLAENSIRNGKPRTLLHQHHRFITSYRYCVPHAHVTDLITIWLSLDKQHAVTINKYHSDSEISTVQRNQIQQPNTVINYQTLNCMYTVSQKTLIFIFWITVKNEPILIIFGTLNPEGTWH